MPPCAVVFHGPGKPLAPIRAPLPALGPGEVLVRVGLCSLCSSDLHTYAGRRVTPLPTVLGHEMLGVVEDAGTAPGLALKAGDRIVWSIAASCGRCFFCRDGLPQKCSRLFKYGHE